MRPSATIATAALLAAALFAVAGRRPAAAATTAMTDAFVAATSQSYALLDGADALALAKGGSARLRAFARRDADREASAGDELAAWGAALRAADKAAALTPSIDRLGPLLYPFDQVVLPFDIHGHRTTDADRAALARLGAAQGPAFDDAYVPAVAAALERLARTYADYIENGDDPDLRRLSVRQLPIVRRLRAELPAR